MSSATGPNVEEFIESVSAYTRSMDLIRDPLPGGSMFMVINGLLSAEIEQNIEKAKEIVDRSVKMQVASGVLHGGDRQYYTGGVGHVTGVLEFYDRTGNERYLEAARKQIDHVVSAPRSSNGGITHTIDAVELWVDSMYIMIPPIAQYGSVTGDDGLIREAADQIVAHSEHLQDDLTGLYRHMWTAKPNDYPEGSFWGRGNGWAAAGILEVIEHLPEGHHRREELISILNHQLETVTELQDSSGFWWNVLDDDTTVVETSASLIFAYVLYRAVELGLTPERYVDHAERALNAVVDQVDEDGVVKGATFATTHDPNSQLYSDDVFSVSTYGQGWYLKTLSHCRNTGYI